MVNDDRSLSAWDSALEQLAVAARHLELDEGMLAVLATPRRSMTVSVPLNRDDGRVEVFIGYRVQHSLTRGPAKGGLRYHPATTLEEVSALAMWMTWKCALIGIPYGGSKGAITVDPRELSNGELERLTRRYASEILPIIGPERDIPAPDVGTTEQTMAWFMDTVSVQTGYTVTGAVTGKPISLGGSHGRTGATSRGVQFVTLDALRTAGMEAEETTVAVQGFGKVGALTAQYLAESGCKVVAVSDLDGGVYDPNGLDVATLIRECGDGRASVADHAVGADKVSNSELLALDVDVLIPAAIDGVLTEKNADNVRAKLIIEAANGPTTPTADVVFAERGITVVPDVLANSGGVAVSYFEWVQDLQAYFWDEPEVNDKLEKVMHRTYQDVIALAAERGVSLRTAAQIIAVGRVAEAHRTRGLYP